MAPLRQVLRVKTSNMLVFELETHWERSFNALPTKQVGRYRPDMSSQKIVPWRGFLESEESA